MWKYMGQGFKVLFWKGWVPVSSSCSGCSGGAQDEVVVKLSHSLLLTPPPPSLRE